MQKFAETVYDESGAGVVGRFLQAINDGDALAFWRLLDRQGKGYFMGMWFYALGSMDLGTVALLAEDENFLKDALAQIVGDLKTSLGPLLKNPAVGVVRYTDSQHAVVQVTAGGTGEQPHRDYIPLVLELASPGEQHGEGRSFDVNVGMTCWKVDTLKCFSFRKHETAQ